jgi:hypothetical protein
VMAPAIKKVLRLRAFVGSYVGASSRVMGWLLA